MAETHIDFSHAYGTFAGAEFPTNAITTNSNGGDQK